jgi:hypothetical protein
MNPSRHSINRDLRIALDVPPMLLARAGLLQRMSLEM